MSILRATYRVVTPLFLAGADQTHPELRIPSFKGALRFWWRFLAWSFYANEDEATVAHIQNANPGELERLRMARLNTIREKEAELFGSSDQDCGQSLLLLRFKHDPQAPQIQPAQQQTKPGFAYMAGQGLTAYNNHVGHTQTKRSFIRSGYEFTVEGLLRPYGHLDEQDLLLLQQAFQLLGLCGGLGARTRRGMGSLTLLSYTSPNGETVTGAPPKKGLSSLLENKQSELKPPYTALWKETRYRIVAGPPTAMDVLEAFGQRMMKYRSYRKDKNFPQDHDDILDVWRGREVSNHPERVGFGLPHNYFYSSTNPKAKVDVEPNNAYTRRASPLFFHVQAFPDPAQQPVGILLFAPADFLPEGTKIKMKPTSAQREGQRAASAQEVDVSSDVFAVVEEFFDNF